MATLDYATIIGFGWPTVECISYGDPFVYENITWVSGDPIPTKAELDAWAPANQTVIDNQNYITVEAPPTGISIAGGKIQSSGTVTLSLSNDLLAVENLTTTGLATRTATDTWTTRTITGTSGNIAVTNGDGVLGNPTLNLETTGVTTGTYNSVTVDTYGRVRAGTTGATIKAFYTGSVAQMTGTSVIPATTAVPLITGGTQIWTTTITPSSVASKFIINFTTTIDAAASQVLAFALFRGTTCIAVCAGQSVHCQTLTLYYVDTPATTAATTYSLRAGTGASTTWYIGREAAATYGGKGSSTWTITEI